MIRLGGKDYAGDAYNIGGNYYIKGGVIDCNNVAKGIAIESGLQTVVSDLVIKFCKVGLHIKWGANSGSADADVHDINITGMYEYDSIGILVEGYDNTFTNIRMNWVQKGMLIYSGGNYITNVHPLYCFHWSWSWNYVNSVAFEDYGANNWYTGCYNDQFAIGFKNRGIHNIYHNCYAFWYSENFEKHIAFESEGPFNSIVTNFTMGIAEWNKASKDNCVLIEGGWGNGNGVFDNLYIDDPSALTNGNHLRYIKGEDKPYEPLYTFGTSAGTPWDYYDVIPAMNHNNGVFSYNYTFPGIFKMCTEKGKDRYDWETLHKSSLIPIDSNDGHLIIPGETFYTKVWNKTEDPGNYVLLYPGTYTVNVKKADLSVSVDWQPRKDNNNEWFFAGNQDGWERHYMNMRYDEAQGKYIMTTTLDRLESWQDFKLFNDPWQQFSYPEDIPGFGTYTFNYYPGNDSRCARVLTPLNNVEITCEWYKNDITHMYVTLSEKKQNSESGVELVTGHDDTECVEYYNLNGVNVAAEQLVPGVYVCKRGDKVTKVIIK